MNLGVAGNLSRTTTAASSTATPTVLAREVATGVTLTTVAATLEATTATASRVTTARSKVAAVESSGLGAARLNNNVLAVNDMRVA